MVEYSVWTMDITTVVYAMLLSVLFENGFSISNPECKIPEYNITFRDENTNRTCGERQVFVRKVSEQKVQITMKKRFLLCCYSYIFRYNVEISEDMKIRYSPCIQFKHKETVPLNDGFMNIRCFNKERSVIYNDYYAFTKKITKFPIDKRQPSIGRKLISLTSYLPALASSRNGPQIYKKTEKKEHGPTYNVLMIGMGSMSRKRAYNSVKDTLAFFKENNWLDFRQYNKIGQNSSTNLIALLTGRSEYIFANKSCSADMSTCNSMFLWHEFQKRGYVTAFGEDLQFRHGTLNSRNKGFSTPPTNHYMRPIFLAGETNSGRSVCTGRIPSGLQILNYILDYMRTYENKRVFGFFNIGSFSRGIDKSPKLFDKSLVGFFKRMKETNTLENTFVIFFSDQGITHGQLRLAQGSYYDERLPMLFMHIPDTLRNSHKFSNLEANQDALISPYDVYLTVWDMLKMSTDESLIPRASGCTKCTSLFQYIPEYRSCSDAGVADQWCACHDMDNTSVKEYGAMYSVVKAAAYLKNKSLVIPTKPCTSCRELLFNKLLRIQSFSLNDVKKYYVAIIGMNPENATYEVTVMKELNRTTTNFDYEVVSVQLIAKNDFKGFNCTIDTNDAHLCLCQTKKRCSTRKSG